MLARAEKIIDNELSHFNENETLTTENIDPFVNEDLPDTLESSGGSSELQASHLQLSTVTFKGLPSPPLSEVATPTGEACELPTNGCAVNCSDNTGI